MDWPPVGASGHADPGRDRGDAAVKGAKSLYESQAASGLGYKNDTQAWPICERAAGQAMHAIADSATSAARQVCAAGSYVNAQHEAWVSMQTFHVLRAI